MGREDSHREDSHREAQARKLKRAKFWAGVLFLAFLGGVIFGLFESAAILPGRNAALRFLARIGLSALSGITAALVLGVALIIIDIFLRTRRRLNQRIDQRIDDRLDEAKKDESS